MEEEMKVSLVQVNTQGDKRKNIADAKRLVEDVVAREHPDLVVLPEYFAFLEDPTEAMHASGEVFPNGEAYETMAALAKKLEITLHAGSMVERDGANYHNTTVVFGPDGQQIARYRKLHLFDIDIPGTVYYKESDNVTRGKDVVTYKVGDVTVGCSICYDLRFPELYRALRDRGAKVIIVPAAFTLMTGKDHWETLGRARAIDTQTYVVMVGQTLSHDAGKNWCWGHSMVINPWGHVIAQCNDGVGTATARLDFDYLEKVRANLPVANHHVL
jgi:nitrilase